MKFILQCIQDELSEFRLPELLSVAKLFKFEITFDSTEDINLVRPLSFLLLLALNANNNHL